MDGANEELKRRRGFDSENWPPEKAIRRSKNMRFSEAVALVQAFGFQLVRIHGSHHVFAHQAIPTLINLQEVRGRVKPYQLRQFLKLVERYNLLLGDDS